VCDVAEGFPTPVICALLGTPRHDRRLFSGWANDIKKIFDWNLAADQACILTAWQQLDDYLEDMVAGRRHTLTDDLISELIRAEDDGQNSTTTNCSHRPWPCSAQAPTPHATNWPPP
jgi:cytochrome P450